MTPDEEEKYLEQQFLELDEPQRAAMRLQYDMTRLLRGQISFLWQSGDRNTQSLCTAMDRLVDASNRGSESSRNSRNWQTQARSGAAGTYLGASL